jgi:hypothetical protein
MVGQPNRETITLEFSDGLDCERVLSQLVADAEKENIRYMTAKCFPIQPKKG